ncbi:MAG: cytotoxic translational repressor of toxin-antitoxin stability system [Nanoarchaeota archaeon]|nr:cytotoxic translational repressor of toxin-antitoxin stability system [Nanoarchaeota archaeon]|tara:strand:+ start:440 stop:688 length:249 start_codon:yes stop_codon:yes gene_type:complete
MYEIILSDKAKKQLKKLQKSVGKRITNSLERLRIRPHSHIKKLVNSPYFSFRVGDHRIILRVNKGKLIIVVINIGPREKVYN